MKSSIRMYFLFAIVLSLPILDLVRSQNVPAGGGYALEVDGDDDMDSLLYCEAGQRLVENQGGNQPEECEPCSGHTYMPSRRHRNHECLPCDTPQSRRETVVVPCTNVANTVLGCATGYYKKRTSERTQEFICVNCRNCSSETPPQFVGRPCTGEDNTFCCKEPGMKVVDGMCVYPKDAAKVCGCGFFDSNPSHTEEGNDPACRPCTECSSSKDGAIYEARPCGRSMDTVCCLYPDANIIFNPKSGLYECQDLADELSCQCDSPPCKTGDSTAKETVPLPQNSCTFFTVLFIIFLLLSMSLCLILVFQGQRNGFRRRFLD